MSFKNEVVIDARDHLMGRLASVVAKQLLLGQKVVVVHCEEIVKSGSHTRCKLQIVAKRRKRTNTNKSKGPFHYHSPSAMFFKTVRGMVPHKTARGAKAMKLLRTYDGVPPPFDKKKRDVVPEALRVMIARQNRKHTKLGALSTDLGWKYGDLVERLEAKRKGRSAEY